MRVELLLSILILSIGKYEMKISTMSVELKKQINLSIENISIF